VTVDKRKFLTILKNLYSGETATINAARKAQTLFEEGEQEVFNAFAFDVGALFIELKEELDAGLEELGDFSDPDPRKWDDGDWVDFFAATNGHRFEEIYDTMALGKPNIDLIWGELENRINFS